MYQYNGINSLINDWYNLPELGCTYTNCKVTPDNINSVYFIVISSNEVDDYNHEKGGLIPVQIKNRGFFSWIDTGTLVDIILLEKEKANGEIIKSNIVAAIFYYLKHDDFAS